MQPFLIICTVYKHCINEFEKTSDNNYFINKIDDSVSLNIDYAYMYAIVT